MHYYLITKCHYFVTFDLHLYHSHLNHLTPYLFQIFITTSKMEDQRGIITLSSIWVSRTGSASDWYTLQEALYKCIDTIQYDTIHRYYKPYNIYDYNRRKWKDHRHHIYRCKAI